MIKILLRLTQVAVLNFLLVSAFIILQRPKINESHIIKKTALRIRSETSQTVQTQDPVVVSSPQAIAEATENLFLEVSKHNLRSDCWITIAGHIYNISSYFGAHPGGDAVLEKYCGSDATNAFATKDKNPASSHSSDAQAMLNQYLVQ